MRDKTLGRSACLRVVCAFSVCGRGGASSNRNALATPTNNNFLKAVHADHSIKYDHKQSLHPSNSRRWHVAPRDNHEELTQVAIVIDPAPQCLATHHK